MAHALRYIIRIAGRFTRCPFPVVGLCRVVGVIALSVAVIAGAQAQAPAPVQSVRFTVFSAQPVKDVAFSPRPNAPAQSLVFQPTARSTRYDYRGVMPLRFVDATTGVVVAEANIPSTIRDALLLFTTIDPNTAGAGKLRYQISVLDDGAARHTAGGLAIINLSGLALTGSINAEKITLKPGLNPTLAIGKSAKIVLSTSFKNRTYQSYTSTITLGRNERALLILFPPFYKGALEVQSRLLLDQPPSAATAVR
jgi:hypothetical protein